MKNKPIFGLSFAPLLNDNKVAAKVEMTKEEDDRNVKSIQFLSGQQINIAIAFFSTKVT